MAAGHPKLKTHPGAELFLSRFAEGEWLGVVRPWLEQRAGVLVRSLVVAPTRGHTHALKRRCVAENVPLLGVEFLTPGLARRKRGAGEDPGRSLQVLVLRSRIEAHLALLGPEDPARLLWRSLASDLEAALGDFVELIRGGFGASDFPRPELREVFGELAAWVGRNGFVLGPMQDVEAGLAPPAAGLAPVADRLLVLAGGPEGWGDFFGLVALARRCTAVTVALAEPEFQGGGGGVEWVEVWQSVLGVEARNGAGADPPEGCEAVADLWSGAEGSAERAEVIVGRTGPDEMERVAAAVDRLLGEGSDNIAVVFPGAGPAHARLARLLGERGVPFADMIGAAGTPPVDTRIQRALVDFYERGCRVEELLALWPLLRSLGLAKVTLGQARAACQRLFDEIQSHSVEGREALLETLDRRHGREVARVARLLLPGWPRELAPADALARFESVRNRLALAEPAGWPVLRAFAERVSAPMPAAALLEAIRSFLPEKGPAPDSAGRGVFARVTLTTSRRAAGVAWSDTIFAEANSGIWPERREPSCWIGDDHRRELNQKGRFSLGVPTGDDRYALERRLLCAIARDTRRRVIFSASRFSEEDPELKLAPNPWMERVMWRKGLMASGGSAWDGFGPLGEPAPRAPAPQPSAWLGIWMRRRDPALPFDEFFLADPTGATRPGRLAAGLIERSIRDPARLWFGAVLRVERVGWGPFSRARRKSIGTAVHRALAAAMRGTPAGGSFFRAPGAPEAALRLEAELAALRARWPADRYWDSFHGDVCRAARQLLGRVFELPAAPYAAVEARMPEGATIPLGAGDAIPVSGQMDLVLSDRPEWPGARVEIVDFKTGGDPRMTARKMESTGASLQLGVYLQAAVSVGAGGGVWMLKPEELPARVAAEELGRALSKLGVLGEHLRSGIYGARTPDRGEHTHGFEWPLACAPIASAVLERKFAATFGRPVPAEDGEGADE
jgi:PD-(D/E)XK nuclease superfamily